jgi:hypothetical protein
MASFTSVVDRDDESFSSYGMCVAEGGFFALLVDALHHTVTIVQSMYMYVFPVYI